MQPGVVLIVYLAILCILAMVIFWHCLGGHKPKEPLGTEVPLTLRAGQTIVGIGETTQGIAFYIGDYVTDEQYYDL